MTQVRHDGRDEKWSNFIRICQDFLRDHIKVVREMEELRLSSMYFYSSSLRTEITLTEMEKA